MNFVFNSKTKQEHTNRIIRVLAASLLLVMLFGSAVFPASTMAEGEDYVSLDRLISIPIGKEEGELALGLVTLGDPGEVLEPDGGPSSYTIASNGDFFIVDTYDNPSPIIQYSSKGEYVRTIPAEKMGGNRSVLLQLS